MVSLEPTESEISQVIDFAGLNREDDRSMVIQALKNNDRNVESVVMSYFDNPDSFRKRFAMQWNDSMFSADRNGEVDLSNGTSFHIEESNPTPPIYVESMDSSTHKSDIIQGVTPPPPDRYGPGAPSRPPSRSGAKSPLGRVVDLTASDIPRFVGQEATDHDMERALRESAQEAGIASPAQVSGIMQNSTSEPYFGPAMRSEYDHVDWAMVPIGLADITSNALPASDRKRQEDAPAFLVQHPNTPASHRLGGLLTILHEIPLARNILLRCGSASETYAYDTEWWKGKNITPSPLVWPGTLGSDLDCVSDDDVMPGFHDEIHRLMAFLDSTERSYGSTSVLTELLSSPTIGPEKQFFETLSRQNKEEVLPLTQIASLAHVFGDDLGDNENGRFGLLEIDHLRSDYQFIQTLYEALDHLMWSDVLSWHELSKESKMAMFKEMGDVVTIKFGGEGPNDPLEIPAELYPEKYLTSRKREAHRIQTVWRETKRSMMRLSEEEETVSKWKDDFGEASLARKDVMEKAAAQWKVLQRYLQSAGHFTGMQKSGFDTNSFPDYHEAPEVRADIRQQALGKVEDVLALTERVLADMDQKLQVINTQREVLKARRRALGRILTEPDKPGRPKPMTCKKYLLRGIATEKDVMYVCRRQQADLIDLDNTPKKPDQWWRLAYAQGEEHPVRAEKIEIKRVMSEVWQETRTPLLVYATEQALDMPRMPLSGPLERFSKADNKAFRQELNLERENQAQPQLRDPTSPAKRKHRSDSMGTLDSNHASLGSDGNNGFGDPFEDQDSNFSFQKPSYQSQAVDLYDILVSDQMTTDYSQLAGHEHDVEMTAGVGEGTEDKAMEPSAHGSVFSAAGSEPELPPRASAATQTPESTERSRQGSVTDVEIPRARES